MNNQTQGSRERFAAIKELIAIEVEVESDKAYRQGRKEGFDEGYAIGYAKAKEELK